MNATDTKKLSPAQREVYEHYNEVARASQVLDNSQAHHYTCEQAEALPQAACSASRGCGNPLSKAELRSGERVLDLGSGGGIDTLIAAQQVGRKGHVYGLDMSPDMLELARRNAAEAGAKNVSFLEGMLEAIPLPDASVDVVTSNCVINLCDDKAAVLREAFRVLVPGGRFLVADMVLLRPELPPAQARAAATILGCTNGVLAVQEYTRIMEDAGFIQVSVELRASAPWRQLEEKAAKHGREALLASLDPRQAHDAIASAYISGRKASESAR
jgi:ubiquinone/menaquinone biosynthesis C-methylase UbiE